MGKYLNISTDSTLGGSSSSDTKVSSEKAVKTYIDNAVSQVGGGTWVYTGHTQVFSGTTLGNKSISLSSVLPSGNTFELLCSIEADTNGVSNVFPASFPVDFRDLNYLQERKFTIYGESTRTNQLYQYSTNAINYIFKFGGIMIPTSSKTLYAKLEGTDSMQFNSFKLFVDAYKVIS